MPLPTLSVKLDGPLGQGGKFALDGHDIADGLTELSVHFKAGDVTKAHLTILVGELDIDAPTLAILEAHVAAQTADAADDEPELACFGEDPSRVVEVTGLGATHRAYVKPSTEEPSHA